MILAAPEAGKQMEISLQFLFRSRFQFQKGTPDSHFFPVPPQIIGRHGGRMVHPAEIVQKAGMPSQIRGGCVEKSLVDIGAPALAVRINFHPGRGVFRSIGEQILPDRICGKRQRHTLFPKECFSRLALAQRGLFPFSKVICRVRTGRIKFCVQLSPVKTARGNFLHFLSNSAGVGA